MAHGGVNKDIPGSAVEVVALRRAALVVGRDEADVRDAADVLASAELRRVVEEEGVKEGDKRGPLATGGWRQAKVSATLRSECTRSGSPWSLMRKSVTAVMPVLFRGSSCDQLVSRIQNERREAHREARMAPSAMVSADLTWPSSGIERSQMV